MAALADRAAVFQIEDFLAAEQAKDLLRFTTAGSVDDGKSTLIGRLLYDSQSVYEDQIKAVTKASVNRSAGPIDFSLLTDGLRAEREQGITIDVAYRYFATARRKFIIADTPGHEQYTRNMATGASTADLAIILIDARNGVLAAIAPARLHRVAAGHPELRGRGEQDGPGRLRRSRLPRHRNRISRISRAAGAATSAPHVYFLPISALRGDNVVRPQPQHAVVRRALLAGVSGDRSGSPPHARHAHSVFRCSA